MKDIKSFPWKLLAVLAVILGYALNLVDVSIGGYATFYNAAVTFCYVIFWMAFLLFNKSDYGKQKLALIIGAITFISAFIVTIVNFTDHTIVYWNTIYLLTFFITPFYGVRFFIHSMEWCMVGITVLTGMWVVACLIRMKKIRNGDTR